MDGRVSFLDKPWISSQSAAILSAWPSSAATGLTDRSNPFPYIMRPSDGRDLASRTRHAEQAPTNGRERDGLWRARTMHRQHIDRKRFAKILCGLASCFLVA